MLPAFAPASQTPTLCPNCRRDDTTKCVESLLTEIHVCRACNKTFVITKPDPARPSAPTW